jgi:cytidine deaminase
MTNEQLIKIAINAKNNAFVPVTNYQVGVALLAKSGTVYIGANVEEYAIPALSNCAERVAIQNAFSHGERKFLSIAIVGSKQGSKKLDEVSPCGVCLQYILDMCKDVDIVYISSDEIKCKKVTDFLSTPFELSEKQ